MRMTWLVLIASAMLLAGCLGHRVAPDQRIPHQLARPARATILVEAETGRWIKLRVEIPAGWWIAGPNVVEPLQ